MLLISGENISDNQSGKIPADTAYILEHRIRYWINTSQQLHVTLVSLKLINIISYLYYKQTTLLRHKVQNIK